MMGPVEHKATEHIHGSGCGHYHEEIGEHEGHVRENAHVHDERCGCSRSEKPFDLIIVNIGMIATPVGVSAKSGVAQSEVAIRKNAWIGIKEGRIVEIGGMEDGRGRAEDFADQIFDAGGLLLTPGLVDSHTHLCFGGWRHKELPLKLKGVPYLEILRLGGGILSTVRATRASSIEALVDKGLWVLDQMLAHGTTTVEAKSGYGLDTETEVKILQAILAMSQNHEIDIVPTFMGAHAVPEEYIEDRNGYVDLVIGEMLPAVASSGLSAYCDVFCEKGVFNPEETKKILVAAKELGLGLKIHADEINDNGGAALAASLGAVSAEHLIHASDEGLAEMAASGTVAVLLPCTSFYLNEDFARARHMIDTGIPVAIASDFNPGSSPNLNMQLAMNIACLKYRMSPEEVLTAATLNAAAALGLAGKTGSIEPGKAADLVVWEAPDLDYLLYRYGTNLARAVIKAGEVHQPGHEHSH